MILGFDDELASGVDPFAKVSSIIVHRSTVVLHGQRSSGDGLMSDGPYALHGQAHMRGPVVLSWSAITSDLFHPRRGRNVVIHEFAHQLDQEKGFANGAPLLPARRRYESWSTVLLAEFQRLQAAIAMGEPTLLSPYGATNPAEFFAVASEVFFEQPDLMAAAHPDLYAELSRFYRVDPNKWGQSQLI